MLKAFGSIQEHSTSKFVLTLYSKIDKRQISSDDRALNDVNLIADHFQQLDKELIRNAIISSFVLFQLTSFKRKSI